MLFNSAITSVDDKFKGIIYDSVTSEVIHQTDLYNTKTETTAAINKFLIKNSKSFKQPESTAQATVVPLKQTVKTIYKRK